MYCKKCGKDIGVGAQCPLCGAEQHSIDPFVALGDIEPNENDDSMDVCANTSMIPSTEPDCFSALGDLEPNGNCSIDAYYANIEPEFNCINPFHSMGNLDGSPTLLDDSGMDAPATGGFKPMDPLNGGESSETEGEVRYGDKPATNGFKPMDEIIPSKEKPTDWKLIEETKKRDPARSFVWKKWMTIAACCTTIICLLLLVVCSGSLQFTNGKYSAESAEKVLEQVLEAPILEVDTEGIETPAFLYSIESRNGYEMLSFEKTQAGAVATMRVFAPDVYDVAKNLDSSNTYTDANALMEALDNALKNALIVEKQVIIEYILTDQGYAPILTAEFLDAYYGGIYQLRDEAIANAAAEG